MLMKLQKDIEKEVSKIGNDKLSNLGIYFLDELPYFPDGINVIENKMGSYNLVFTERGTVTHEMLDLSEAEVTYQILKIVVHFISSQNIGDLDEQEVNEMISKQQFDKVSQIVEQTKEERRCFEKELLNKIDPVYSTMYETDFE